MAVKKDTKTGTWYFYGSYKMMNGKTKQYKKRGFAKKKDAVKAEILFRADIKTPYKNLTLEELFTLYSEYTEKRIKESTYNAQTSILQRWIDIIGKDMLIKKVTTSSLEYAMELMIRKTNSNSAANYLNRLNKMFRFAVQKGYLEVNPCAQLEVVKNPNEKRNEMKYWTLDQFNLFIPFVKNPMYNLLFKNQFYNGTRIGEALALTWEDIDFENKTITINKTWSKDLHQVTTPKTNNSYRTITIPSFLCDNFKAYKELLDVPDKSFIFGIDMPISTSTIRSRMRKAIMEANQSNEEQIPTIRIHDLRHSCASYMIGNMVRDGSSNFSLYDVAKRLGDNLNTVLSVYAHWLPQADKGIVQIMDKDNALD